SDGEDRGAPGARRSRATWRPEPSLASGATVRAFLLLLCARVAAAGTADGLADALAANAPAGGGGGRARAAEAPPPRPRPAGRSRRAGAPRASTTGSTSTSPSTAPPAR